MTSAVQVPADVRRPRDVIGDVFRLPPVGTALVVGGLLTVLLSFSRVPLVASLEVAALLAVNTASYACIWFALKGRPGTLSEAIASGVAGTFAVPAVLHFVVGQVDVPGGQWVAWLAGPACLGILMLAPKTRGVLVAAPRVDWWPVAGGIVASITAAVLNRWQFPRYPLQGTVDFTQFHPDMIFLQANSIANATHPVGQIGVMSDWPARYHWLSYGWVGSLDSTLSLPTFTGLTRALPLLAILGVSFFAASLVGRWSTVRWLPVLAAALVAWGRLPGDSTALVVNWDSPSQTSSTVLLLMGLLLAFELRGSQWRPWRMCTVAAVLAFATMGFKSSAGTILIAAIIATAAFGSASRQSWSKRAWAMSVAILAGGALAFLLLLVGNGTGQALTPRWTGVDGLSGLLVGSAAALATTLALIPSAVAFSPSIATPPGRGRPTTWFALGAFCSGIAVMWLLAEAGPNNRWFLTSAIALLWVVAAGSVALVLPTKYSSRAILWSIGCAGAATLSWAWLASLLDMSAIAAQLLFLALLGLALGAAVIILRLGSKAVIPAVAVIAVACLSTPLWTVVAERAFPVGPSAFAPEAELPSTLGPAESPVGPPDAGAVQRASARLSEIASPGDIVALADDQLLPVLFASRTIPFVAGGYYAPHAGPVGTGDEYDRRRALVLDALASRSDGPLCQEGVKWVVFRDGIGLQVRATACP